MAKLDELMKDENFLKQFEAVQEDEEAMEKLLAENGISTSDELSEEDLDGVSGGAAISVLLAGLGVMAAKSITPRVVADSTVINYGYAMYKITGKSKYINSSSFRAAEKRMRTWSQKNKVSWNDLIGVLSK